jgi:ribosome-binding factor A
MDGIQSAATFLRRELRDRVALRYTPFLSFALDDTLEEADHLFQIMDRIREDDIPEPPSSPRIPRRERRVPFQDEA